MHLGDRLTHIAYAEILLGRNKKYEQNNLESQGQGCYLVLTGMIPVLQKTCQQLRMVNNMQTLFLLLSGNPLTL